MDFDKLKKSGRKIKMPNDMKNRIKEKCVEYKAPEAVSKPQRRLDGRLVAACVCGFLLLMGIGLKYSGAFDRKIPVESTTSHQTTKESSTVKTEFSTIKQIVETTVKVFQTDNTTRVFETHSKTTTEAKTYVQQTESFTLNEQLTTDEYIVQYAPPSTLYMDDLSVLKDAKRAAETMSVEEYRRYLFEKEKNNYRYFSVADCFYYPEEYLEFCESELYVPVINEEELDVLWMNMDYVPSYELIDMVANFNESDGFRFYVDTSGDFYSRTKDDEKYRYVETAKIGNAEVEIYRRKVIYQINDSLTSNWAWGGIAAEITVDGQRINLLSTVEVTLKEFKEYLKHVDFIKIKDWI